MSLDLKEVIKIATTQLEKAGIEDAEIDAKELYMFLQKYNKVDLLMHWSDVIGDNQVERYFELVEKRASRTPLQHIVGSQEFMGLKFKVSPQVLIPRLDTEPVVEEALKYLNKASEVLDLCSGSGAIGISIAKLKECKVTCSDVSDDAIKLGEENARLNQVKVKFVKSDMLKKFSVGLGKKKYDMIISNPPYIESKVISTLEPEVKEHEPITALDGGKDGLDFYRIIAEEAPSRIKKNGMLVLEIGSDQGESVKKLLKDSNSFADIEVKKDLANHDRIVVAKLLDKKKCQKETVQA